MRTVVITGIGGRLATLVAGALAAQPRIRVIGVGQVLPATVPATVELQQCDMRSASVLELLRRLGADTLLHMDHSGAGDGEPAGGARGNVFRAIEVLGAAAAAGVSRVVLRSSTLVYGAGPSAPAFIAAHTAVAAGARAGLVHDYAEIERVAADYTARYPAMRVAAVRCAPLIGGGISSPISRFLTGRRAPVMLGFNPRIQLLHAHDAAVALALAALADDLAEPINVAADPPMPLEKAIQLAGGRPVPLPSLAFAAVEYARNGPLPGIEALATAVATPLAGLLGTLPFEAAFLRYACVADTGRARELIAWEPQHTAEEALRELAGAASAAEKGV